jgi:hypothetical protein
MEAGAVAEKHDQHRIGVKISRTNGVNAAKAD